MMKRNKFSLSHTKLLSCDMGELVPCGLVEVLPGDTMQQASSVLLRVAPLLSPVFHNVDVRVHHWFVPHRLVMADWENFITGGPDGNNATVFPTITMPAVGGAAVGSLADYLGVPTGINSLEVSALPFRAYGLIFNEWYRDQDLVSPLTVSVASGADNTTNTVLQNCAWEKDYFTSSRPWEQKGPAVTIPLGTTAPLALKPPTLTPSRVRRMDGATHNNLGFANSGSAGELRVTGAFDAAMDVTSHTVADISGASAITVTRLREALAIQRYEEARARYGSRFTEYLRYLGVRSSDARLQRPEYLGGGRQNIQFSEVLQTAEGDDPVGTMRGHGISGLRSNRYRRFFEEHGYVISLVSIRPKTIYMQGLPRTWNRRTRDEFWQKEFQHIGQQEVLNKEIDASHAQPNGVFGYQDRYDEYRRMESSVSGEFRTLLNFWHMARDFSTDPALNADFVECVPTDRNFAAQDNDTMYLYVRHSIQARRLPASTGTSFIF